MSDTVDAGQMPSASRQSFLEQVRSVLDAPMPACLQGATFARGPPARAPSSDDRLLRLLGTTQRRQHPSIDNNTTRIATTADTGGLTEPFYLRLLAEGRRAEERREQLTLAAAEAEVADMRPAPTLPVGYTPQPLPPEGSRIEDRLLRAARVREEELEQQRHEQQQQREAQLRASAPFHPRITPRARAARTRYTEAPQDFEAWRARRRQEVEAARAARRAAEEAELRDRPAINPRSAALAARRKRRESLERDDRQGVEEHVAGSQLGREVGVKPLRWQRPAYRAGSGGNEETGRPTISEMAASLQRRGPVADRLYADAAQAKERREACAQVADNVAPFRPTITARAAAAATRYDQLAAVGRDPDVMDVGEADHGRFTPVINPVSAAIARSLPESSWERLQRPACARREADCPPPSPTLQSQFAPQRRATPLPAHLADAFDAYEERRRERLRVLAEDQAARERAECTFVPAVNCAGPSSSSCCTARPLVGVEEVSGASDKDCEDPTITDRGPSGVAARSQRWLSARERRLQRLRELRQSEEAAELERARRWREASGLFPANRSVSSQRASTPRGGAAPASVNVPQRGSTPLWSSWEASPLPTVGAIYERLYRVDPSTKW